MVAFITRKALIFFSLIRTSTKAFSANLTVEAPSLLGATMGLNATDNLSIDPLTTTAKTLQKYLEAGSVTSLELVDIYVKQIEANNRNGLKLNAVISTAPYDLVSQYAKDLDAERAAGKARGPLHGIPIIVKDNIMTDSKLGMDTTCGAYALKGAKAGNAPIIERILKAGMIIIAKANLSVCP